MHIVEQKFKEFVESESIKSLAHFFIAYSGGVDSQVLLNLAAKYLSGKVTALHVNHGISSNAKTWENFCKETAESLGVAFKSAHFELANEKSNLEEVARICRYGFFEENVKENTALITGHHLDDQAETFMLRLMRGSGVDGLASMPQSRPFKDGSLVRPLLEVSKEEIIEFAIQKKLKWVEDESNKSSDYDRNFIRNEVMPLLKTRWAQANKSIARSAKHCEVAKTEMKQEDSKDFEAVSVVENKETKLSVEKLIKLSKEKQKRVIRFWLNEFGVLMPTSKNLEVIINELVMSKPDSQSCFETSNYELRKAFGEIFFINKSSPFVLTYETPVEEPTKDMRMSYKGTIRSFKYVMKAEKVPYRRREEYKAVVENGKVIAFGDITAN